MADGPVSPAATPPVVTQVTPAAPVDLRPLTTSELIDRGFALYRAHFAGFLLLALLCQSAPLLHQIALTSFKLSPWQTEFWENLPALPARMTAVALLGLVTLIIVFCFEVIITFYIADAYLGKIPSVKACLRKFRSCLFTSIWTCVLNWFVIGLTFIFPLLAYAAIYFYALFYPPLTFSRFSSLGSRPCFYSSRRSRRCWLFSCG